MITKKTKKKVHSTGIKVILDTEPYTVTDEVEGSVDCGTTIIPRQTMFGGIDGSDNPYGKIIIGKTYKGTRDRGRLKHMVPNRKSVAGIDNKVDSSSLPTEEEEYNDEDETVEKAAPVAAVRKKESVIQQVADPAESTEEEEEVVEEDLGQVIKDNEELLENIIKGKPIPETRAPVVQAARPVSTLSIYNKTRHSIVIKTPFGKFKGRCVHIADSETSVIVIYSKKDAMFEPASNAPGSAPIELEYQGKKTKVYYLGMDIDLETDNLSMQVYFKHKE
jgi:hypothetical protein